VSDDTFYERIPPFDRFDDVVDTARYHRLPDDWLVGASDVVNSTGAIAEGRYKAVNVVGASTIAAVYNALDGAAFPFVFGGDGAGFAVPASARAKLEPAIGAARTWAREEVGLELRAALAPVEDIRRAGHDISVARYSVAPALAYAMFAGGGMAWAEAEMKAGRYEVAPAPPGSKPNLDGLSCRFMPIAAERGEILSLLLKKRPSASPEDFARLVRQLIEILDTSSAHGGNPSPAAGPRFVWPPQNLGLESRVMGGKGGRFGRSMFILLQHLMLNAISALGARLPGFDPKAYRREVSANTDFRKFGDGLMLTVDCSADVIARLEVMLERAQVAGVADHGVHRQDAALMTCFVPDPFARDHMHFVDGAGGGYAKAAEMLKRQIAASSSLSSSP
jgi:hypothetical protein